MPELTNPDQPSPSTPLPAVDGPTVIDILVTHGGWHILEHDTTHAGLKKHGYLGTLMVPMKRGQAVAEEWLRSILKEAGMEPAAFAALLQTPSASS